MKQSHFAVLSIGVLSPENQFRGHKNRACIHGTQAPLPEKGRTKARVPICPISQNEIKPYLYPQPLMHIRHRIYIFLENKKGGRRQDRVLPLGGIHPADALLRTLTVTGTVHRVQPATFKGFI